MPLLPGRRRLAPALTGLAVAAVAASTAVTGTIGAAAPALAATGRTAATSPAATSQAAAIVADATYRGAEHEFTVLDAADAAARYGARSTQFTAARAVVADNVRGLATDLTELTPSASGTVATALDKRADIEIAYAAASLAVHKKVRGSAAKQAQALQSLAAEATVIGRALSQLYPSTTAADDTALVTAVDKADTAALEAASRTGVDRFPKAKQASSDLGVVAASLAAAEVRAGRIPGDITDPHALARAAGALVGTQHVYLVGQLLETSLLTGSGSGQTLAAKFWVNVDSGEAADLLGLEGLNQPLVLGAWRGHINGYQLFTAYLESGNRGDLRQAGAWLNGYIGVLAHEIAGATSIPVTTASAGLTEHVLGTEQVARDLKVGAPRVYAEAEMGAQHLTDLLGQLAAVAPLTPAASPRLRTLARG